MAPSHDDLVIILESTLATAGAAELAHIITKLGLSCENTDVESLRREIQRNAWG